MTVQDHDSLAREARRAHIEALLADYPALDEDEVALVRTWFTKQASSLDVAQVASNTAIASQYRAFRAEHIDRFSSRDILNAAVAVAAIVLCIVAIMWRAL
jgi:hypothetical protein